MKQCYEESPNNERKILRSDHFKILSRKLNKNGGDDGRQNLTNIQTKEAVGAITTMHALT